jgi:hypothetical protein
MREPEDLFAWRERDRTGCRRREPHELVRVISSAADLVFMIGWVLCDEYVYATKFSVKQRDDMRFQQTLKSETMTWQAH